MTILAPAEIMPAEDEHAYIILRRSLKERHSRYLPAEVEVFDDTPCTQEQAGSNVAELKKSPGDWFYFARRIDRVDPALLASQPKPSWDIESWWEQTCLPDSEVL